MQLGIVMGDDKLYDNVLKVVEHTGQETSYEYESDSYSFSESLKEIFSVLPDEQALEARHRALQGYSKTEQDARYEIRWADFDGAGQFEGGGIVDIIGHSFQMISKADNDEDIFHLVTMASEGPIKAGLMEYSISKNAIIWFLPTVIRTKKGIGKPCFRALLISEETAHKVIDIFNPNELITKAEKHLIFQLLAGMSLNMAAETDSLKIETKRSQLKSIRSKLQCGSQNDLLRYIMGQFTYLLSLTDIQANRSVDLLAFTKTHLPSDIRLTEHRLSNDRVIRILERGPVTGKAVLVIHGLLWPLIMNSPLKLLKEHNIRMIVPIRSGYIDKQGMDDVYGKNDLVAESLQDIALFQKEYLDQNMPVLGTSYGGVIALKYAKLFPEFVSHLFIVAICTAQASWNEKNVLGRLYFGLKSLANKPGIFRYIAWQYKKYYADERTVKPILQNIYKSCKADIDVIDGRYESSPIYPCFVDLFQKSISGIADDFKIASNDIKKIAKDITTETVFIHGHHDPMLDTNIVKGYAGVMRSSEVEFINSAGHHIFNTHPKTLWHIVTKTIQSSG